MESQRHGPEAEDVADDNLRRAGREEEKNEDQVPTGDELCGRAGRGYGRLRQHPHFTQLLILVPQNFKLNFSFFPSPTSTSFHHNRPCASMESLSDTDWDVVISGTGLQQSLFAL